MQANHWRKPAPLKTTAAKIVRIELAMITAPSCKALALQWRLEKLRAVQAQRKVARG